jgi:uncharacterized protein YegL
LNSTSSVAPSFEIQRPRPLPVIILADGSGSMGQDNKIETLNAAIETMVRRLVAEDSSTTEITLTAIVFSERGAVLHQPPVPVSEVRWTPLRPDGKTPLGEAFALAARLMAEVTFVPPDAYLPTFVLVSDGMPTDSWEQPLQDLLETRAGKALRLAVSIGADSNASSHRVLESFVANPAYPVVQADEVDKLTDFFRGVTRTITTRVRSPRPDDLSSIDISDLRRLVD